MWNKTRFKAVFSSEFGLFPFANKYEMTRKAFQTVKSMHVNGDFPCLKPDACERQFLPDKKIVAIT